MSEVSAQQVTELFATLVKVYARQMAILRLLHHESHIPAERIDAEIQTATQRLKKMPALQAALSSNDLTQIQKHLATVKGVSWDRWDVTS